MIERKFVAEKRKEFQIKEYVNEVLKKAGQSDVKLKKTPLGEKITISAFKPGLVVGRKGENIKLLTAEVKRRFNLDNPQIEIEEITNPNIDPKIIAERIATTMERFGSARFKQIGHRVLDDIMKAGALGAEVLISGKIPSSRAKRWRFYQGYLKKSGFISQEKVLRAYTTANLKTGTVGIQVRILSKDVVLPDRVVLREVIKETIVEEAKVEEKKEAPKKKRAKKAAPKKASKKKEEVKVEEKTQENKTEAKEEKTQEKETKNQEEQEASKTDEKTQESEPKKEEAEKQKE